MKKKFILTYEKSKEMENYLKTGVELKLFLEKTGFLKFIWKLESWELNLRIGILEIKFDRNWNF